MISYHIVPIQYRYDCRRVTFRHFHEFHPIDFCGENPISCRAGSEISFNSPIFSLNLIFLFTSTFLRFIFTLIIFGVLFSFFPCLCLFLFIYRIIDKTIGSSTVTINSTTLWALVDWKANLNLKLLLLKVLLNFTFLPFLHD